MALVPPAFVDSVVAIGESDGSMAEPRWIATGFFYGIFDVKNDKGESRYFTYLVTNRHVFDGVKIAAIRANHLEGPESDTLLIRLIDENGKPTWHASSDPDVDVAVVQVNWQELVERRLAVSFLRSDAHAARVADLRDDGVSEGDYGFVLGFPVSLIDPRGRSVVLRGGPIARIRDCLNLESKTFLLDAVIFPGNSGGPVILKPEIVAITGTKSHTKALLIGIVSGYLPFRDIAVSQQTQQPRIIFEENSGISIVYPVDCIEAAISEHERAIGRIRA